MDEIFLIAIHDAIPINKFDDVPKMYIFKIIRKTLVLWSYGLFLSDISNIQPK